MQRVAALQCINLSTFTATMSTPLLASQEAALKGNKFVGQLAWLWSIWDFQEAPTTAAT